MNTNINLEGVILSRQQTAKKEIAEYLEIFSRSLSTDILISNIIVAADFKAEVNQIWSDGKENGLKYDAKHHTGRAVGKTLNAIVNNEISHDVIIDGAYIGNWEDNEKATRFELFMHEFIHAYLNHNRFKTMGADGFKNDYLTIEGVCFQLALTSDEYIVDSYLDILCKKFLTGDDKQPLSLHQLNLARSIDYLDTYIKMLDNLPGIVRENAAAFKHHEKSMNDVWNILSSYVEEMLTVFAHLAASREKEDDWDSVKKTISGTEAHKKYLAGRVKAIYTEWVNYFLENYDEVKSLKIIGDEIQGIFYNCGFRFKNVAKGIYITITDKEN